MQKVMTPTGACKYTAEDLRQSNPLTEINSRFLCWAEPDRLVHDLLFRQRDQAADPGRNRP